MDSIITTDLPTPVSERPFSMDMVVRNEIKAQLVNGQANGFILVRVSLYCCPYSNRPGKT